MALLAVWKKEERDKVKAIKITEVEEIDLHKLSIYDYVANAQ